MNFNELVNKINSLNVDMDIRTTVELKGNDEYLKIQNIVDEINIDENNFNDWVDKVFSEDVDKFDMNKLPYLIDVLYQSNDKLKFMLCCMLIEATCTKLEFMTNLEDYPLFEAKFQTLANTLVTVYDRVDNGIANCMSLIILNTDPELRYFDEEQKDIIKKATIRKLTEIYNYIKNGKLPSIIYNELELIVDLACYLNSEEINNIVEELDKYDNGSTDIFIIKYKIINKMQINKEKIDKLKNEDDRLWSLYNVLENLGVNNIYLNDITQEQIAKSDMIRWLSYPTELGSRPDKIELLGNFIFNDTKCYAFKFSKEGFRISGDLIGVAGGYPIDKVSSDACGYTFSKFENVSDDWLKQANGIVQMIYDYWKNRG